MSNRSRRTVDGQPQRSGRAIDWHRNQGAGQNDHGTATEHGDIAETRATSALFGTRVLLRSQKSYLGHTLGACGALEPMFTIEMMRAGWFAPTVNLENVDPRCGELDYIVGPGRELDIEYAVNNIFAFGAGNTSLVFRRRSCSCGLAGQAAWVCPPLAGQSTPKS